MAEWRLRSFDDGSCHTLHLEDLDVSNVTFRALDLTTFSGLCDLGLKVAGQLIEPEREVWECRLVESDDCWRRCAG